MYLAGILELFHRPAVISSGSSIPEAARSWAMPTRPEWPVKPSPRPAAFAAPLTLRPIWLAESSKTRLAGVHDGCILGHDRLQGLGGLLADVQDHALCLRIRLGSPDMETG